MENKEITKNSNVDKVYLKVKEKSSNGWIWFLIGFMILLISVPLILFGTAKSTYNATSISFKWFKDSDERKIEKNKRKQKRIETHINRKKTEKELKIYKQKLKEENDKK